MRTNIIKLITFFSITALLVSCSNREEDLFKEPASTRLEKNRSQYQNILESSEQGWVLQYFPHPEQKFGGINYYVNFKNGNVTATIDGTENEISSTYSVINRGGNLLSFNSYNPILHAFANPSGREPKGFEGDFEFLILNHKDNVVNLKGVRSGNLMKLIKLDKNYKDYKNKVNEINNYLSNSTLGVKMGDSNIEVSLDNFTLNFRYKEGDDIKSEKVAFVTTDRGISLYEPFIIKGISIQDLLFNKETKSFLNVDKEFVLQIILPPISFTQKWSLTLDPNKEEVCQKILDLQKQAADAIDKRYPMLFLLPQYDFGTLSGDMFGIRFDILDGNTFAVYGSSYKLNFVGILGDETLLDIIPISPYPENQGSFWEYFPPLKIILDNFIEYSPYKIEKDNEDNPTVVKMVSTKDSDFWFVLKK